MAYICAWLQLEDVSILQFLISVFIRILSSFILATHMYADLHKGWCVLQKWKAPKTEEPEFANDPPTLEEVYQSVTDTDPWAKAERQLQEGRSMQEVLSCSHAHFTMQVYTACGAAPITYSSLARHRVFCKACKCECPAVGDIPA